MNKELKEKIVTICLPEWDNEDACRCGDCLAEANKRMEAILSSIAAAPDEGLRLTDEEISEKWNGWAYASPRKYVTIHDVLVDIARAQLARIAPIYAARIAKIREESDARAEVIQRLTSAWEEWKIKLQPWYCRLWYWTVKTWEILTGRERP